MKTVKAKLKCDSVEKFPAQETVKFSAVYGNGENENAQFSKYTPFVQFMMSITNEALFGHFQPGAEYFVDITEAVKAE